MPGFAYSPRRRVVTTSPTLEGREVLLGVTGGVAAYKAADLASKLVQAGVGVTAVLSAAAAKFVGRTTFEALTGRAVHGDLWSPGEHFRGPHIGLAEKLDLMIVAPATADYLAKVAHGLADDLLATLALTVECPLVVAPAMNTAMWEKPATQRNVARVKEDGVHVVEPGEGWLSCGRVGAGRMAEPVEILERVTALLG